MIPLWIIIISFIIWVVSYLLTLSKIDSALHNNLPFEERHKIPWFVLSFIIYKLSRILSIGMILWNLIIILSVTIRDMT